ncbi:MAG: sulfotransferase domain-containing protein [Moorea sp. SIO3G5]|nr:sulfotransferase domain-containing protein [Moorena sp. SIO3G5]
MKNILIAGYPRSGNTWVNSLFSYYFNAPYYDAAIEEAILTGKSMLDVVRAYNDAGLSGEHHRSDQKKEILSVIQTHALADKFCHTHPKFLAKQSYNSADFLVLIVREPKDVAVSYFYYRLFFERRLHQHWSSGLPVTWREWFYHRFYFQKFVLNVAREWTTFHQNWLVYNPFVIHYESLLSDPVAQIKRFTDAFGLSCYTQYAKEAEEFCRFSNLGKREARHLKDKKVVYQNEKFIRSGKAGGWKEYFSTILAENFDNITAPVTTKLC